MPRPANGRCRNIRGYVGGRPSRCGRELPPDSGRSARTRRTDVCDPCAEVKLAAYARSAAGRAWLARWNAVMDDLKRLVREMGVTSHQ